MTATCDDGSQTLTGVLALSLFCTAIFIVLVLGFTQRRVRLCRNCCWGLPGVVAPLDLLVPTRHRFIYVIIFGAASSTLSNQLISKRFEFEPGSLAGMLIAQVVVYPLMKTLVVAILHLPLLVTVDAPIPVIGHALGLPYAGYLIGVLLHNDLIIYRGCTVFGSDRLLISLYVISNLSLYFCFLIIALWYMYQLARDVWRLATGGCKKLLVRECDTKYHEKSVRWILKRSATRKEPGCLETAFDYLSRYNPALSTIRGRSRLITAFNYICPYNSGFKFPLRFLAVIMVMSTYLCKLTCVMVYLATKFGITLLRYWKDVGRPVLKALSTSAFDTEPLYNKVLQVLSAVEASLALSTAIPLLLCVILLVHMVASVHKDMRGAAKGSPPIGKRPHASFLLASSLQYAGLQIGYFISAWIIYTVTTFFAVLLVAIVIVFNIKTWIGFIVLTLIWMVIIWLAQVLLCKFVFVQPGSGKFVLIKNRRIFNLFRYLMFFYNSLIGIVSSLLRVLVSTTFSILLLFRLDKVVLMKGFEFADDGHRAYKAFLYLEYCYNNAILHVFVKLLVRGLEKGTRCYGLSDGYGKEGDGKEADCLPLPEDPSTNGLSTGMRPVLSRRARNRWLVAYTLLRNPSIQGLTASRLMEERTREVAVC